VVRSGTGNGPLRPLALRFDAQMRADFMEGDFHLPAPGKPEQDLDRIGLLVGAEQGLGRKLAQGIADEHPANGRGDKPRVVPEGVT